MLRRLFDTIPLLSELDKMLAAKAKVLLSRQHPKLSAFECYYLHDHLRTLKIDSARTSRLRAAWRRGCEALRQTLPAVVSELAPDADDAASVVRLE